MAYHIFTSDGVSHENPLFDRYLGSAVTINFYWESVGRKLNLPLIASLTERADSEEGFVLAADGVVAFKSELETFEKYWIEESSSENLPENFLENIRIIKEGVNAAIRNGLTLMVG